MSVGNVTVIQQYKHREIYIKVTYKVVVSIGIDPGGGELRLGLRTMELENKILIRNGVST